MKERYFNYIVQFISWILAIIAITISIQSHYKLMEAKRIMSLIQESKQLDKDIEIIMRKYTWKKK